MLEWFAAVFVLIAVALLWPAKRYFGFEPRPGVLLGGLGRKTARRPSRELDRCVSDPCPAAGAPAGEEPVSLICKPSALANYLLKHCVTFSNFVTALTWSWRASPFLQTVFSACWPLESSVHFMREYLQLSDDGLVALDWAVAGSVHHRRRRTSSNSTSPILLVIPNSFGKITRNVLKRVRVDAVGLFEAAKTPFAETDQPGGGGEGLLSWCMRPLARWGWDSSGEGGTREELCQVGLAHGYLPVVFSRRSQNGTPLSTPRLQQFGDPADLREAVRYIRYRQPAGRLYAVSESTGAGLLLSYLGECGSSSYVTAAACLSPIFRCQSWFESGPPWPFLWALLLYQKVCLSRYKTALGDMVQMDKLFSSCSLRALEEALFCHPALTGGWEAYWERNDPLRDVDEVAIPVLCLCSRDDPVRGAPAATLPFELFETNPHFFLLLTAQGGHCGFSTPGEEGALQWSHRALLEFFRATTDFFAAEERSKQAARRRGLGGGTNIRAFRHRSVSTCKRVPACSHNIHAIFSWQRSYTR
ncbi:ABH15 protein, partial [Atractosteus spatula]|nr:ABH15 protein [Atractosteus spatula]